MANCGPPTGFKWPFVFLFNQTRCICFCSPCDGSTVSNRLQCTTLFVALSSQAFWFYKKKEMFFFYLSPCALCCAECVHSFIYIFFLFFFACECVVVVAHSGIWRQWSKPWLSKALDVKLLPKHVANWVHYSAENIPIWKPPAACHFGKFAAESSWQRFSTHSQLQAKNNLCPKTSFTWDHHINPS